MDGKVTAKIGTSTGQSEQGAPVAATASPSLKDRLLALCERMHAGYKDFDEKGCCDSAHGAIYRIEEPSPGMRRLRITDPMTGDSISASGPTLEAAIASLEEKLK